MLKISIALFYAVNFVLWYFQNSTKNCQMFGLTFFCKKLCHQNLSKISNLVTLNCYQTIRHKNVYRICETKLPCPLCREWMIGFFAFFTTNFNWVPSCSLRVNLFKQLLSLVQKSLQWLAFLLHFVYHLLTIPSAKISPSLFVSFEEAKLWARDMILVGQLSKAKTNKTTTTTTTRERHQKQQPIRLITSLRIDCRGCL